jgi:hypothetical protein
VTEIFRRSKPDPELIISVKLPARHGAAMGAKIQLKLSGFEIRYSFPDPESSELDKIPGHVQLN